VSKAAPSAVYGVILIAVMFLMPAGAGGFLHAMWRKLFIVRPGQDGVPGPVEAVSYESDPGLTVPATPLKPRSSETVSRSE